MRIATYNVEWFDRLFDDTGDLLEDGAWSARWNVTRRRQIAALCRVFAALDADAVLVIEAPDTSSHRSGQAALETFAARAGIRARRALIGFANDTMQEIALLYDPDRIRPRHDPQDSEAAPRFDRSFLVDLDVDAAPDTVRWSKPPLELALDTDHGPIRLIGVHAKSKSTHGATEAARITRAIANRRKQLAQCLWLRARIDDHVAAGDSLIVAGDCNDGPGLDEFEALFGRSGLEIVLGEGAGRLIDPHALPPRSTMARPASARFWDRDGKRWVGAMLDYAMLTPDLAARAQWRIWHPFDDPVLYADADLRDALIDASDHFPVTVELSGTRRS